MELIQILPGHLRRFAQKIQDGTCTDEDKKEIYSAFEGPEKKRVKKILYSTEQKIAHEKLYSRSINSQRGLLQTAFIIEQDVEKFSKLCKDIFEAWKDPYAEFLALYGSLHDCRSPNEGTMTKAFVQHYVAWMTSHPSRDAREEEYLTEEVQIHAYRTITQYHLRDYESLTEIFHFNAAGLKVVQRQAVVYLVNLKRYKEAMSLSLKTGVLCKTRAFLIPLIFKGCFAEVINYCNKVAKYRVEILQFLDGFCFTMPDTMVERMRQDHGAELVDEGMLRYLLPKTVKKAVHKMLDEFDLKNRCHELAKNFWWLSREEAIKWFQNRRYREHTLQKSCFDDLVMKYLDGAEINRKVWFVNELWKDKKNREASDDALEFKIRFGLEDHLLRDDMLECINNYPDWVEHIRRRIERGAKEEDLNSLIVKGKPIILVDSVEEAKKYIGILKEQCMLGIDSETVDEIILPTKMALLQISISSSIILFDFYKLEKEMSREDREEFMAALLMSDGRKLGFDLVNDLTTMTTRGGTKYVENNKNCLCLKKLITQIQEVDPEFMDLQKRRILSEDEAEQPLSFGLSDLCKKLLNMELDKSEQLSNWSCRPLRAKQVKYAALDAEILIAVYEKIRERAEERSLDFEELVNASLSDKDLAKREKKTGISIQNMNWEAICDVLEVPLVESRVQKATAYKCAVDQMHLGLGMHLRRLGIDVYIPKKNGRKITEYCQLDTTRKLISSGAAYRALSSTFPTRVLNVSNGLSQIAQLKFILENANIRLDKKDTFSRCKDCNYCWLVIVPMPVMDALIKRSALYVDEDDNGLEAVFNCKDWKQKLRELNCFEYDGYGCRVDESADDWFQVDVFAGRLDIDRAVVIHEKSDEFVEIKIDEVSSQELLPGKLFFICGYCGVVHYEKS